MVVNYFSIWYIDLNMVELLHVTVGFFYKQSQFCYSSLLTQISPENKEGLVLSSCLQ